MFLFFFKQKTSYDMRISYWSSDVCSSDLPTAPGSGNSSMPWRLQTARQHSRACRQHAPACRRWRSRGRENRDQSRMALTEGKNPVQLGITDTHHRDRENGVLGKRCDVRVGLGGSHNKKKKKRTGMN